MANKVHIFNISGLEDLATKEFNYTDPQGETIEAFVVKNGDLICAYKNMCPHTGAELNWQPNNFLNFDDSFIICSIHGALFQLEDGLCIQGPCVMQSLEALPICIEENNVFLLQ